MRVQNFKWQVSSLTLREGKTKNKSGVEWQDVSLGCHGGSDSFHYEFEMFTPWAATLRLACFRSRFFVGILPTCLQWKDALIKSLIHL